jgi:hypothetical protein
MPNCNREIAKQDIGRFEAGSHLHICRRCFIGKDKPKGLFGDIKHYGKKEAFIPSGMDKLWAKEIEHAKHYPYGDD